MPMGLGRSQTTKSQNHYEGYYDNAFIEKPGLWTEHITGPNKMHCRFSVENTSNIIMLASSHLK